MVKLTTLDGKRCPGLWPLAGGKATLGDLKGAGANSDRSRCRLPSGFQADRTRIRPSKAPKAEGKRLSLWQTDQCRQARTCPIRERKGPIRQVSGSRIRQFIAATSREDKH